MKKNLIAAFAISAVVLTGCASDIEIDPANKPDRNDITDVPKNYSQVFNGAVDMKVCTVDGAQLKRGMVHNFQDGLLIINGDVPEDAVINVTNGKLYISGDVNKGAKVSATVPYSDANGFIYPLDQDPAVIIMRDVKAGASISTNHGFHIGRFFHNTTKISIEHDVKSTHGRMQMPKLYIEPSLKVTPKP